jgi:hypothetical protein
VLEGGVAKLFRKRTSSIREYDVRFARIIKEVLDGRNSPREICKVPRAIRSCRGARKLRWVFFYMQAQEKIGL